MENSTRSTLGGYFCSIGFLFSSEHKLMSGLYVEVITAKQIYI